MNASARCSYPIHGAAYLRYGLREEGKHMGLIKVEDIRAGNFVDLFEEIVGEKEAAGIAALQNNPDDLLQRAQAYGVQYSNGSWGWNSNIWHRSAPNTAIIDREEDMRPEHRQLMLRALEHMLCRPMIQVDRNLGTPGTPSEMRCRVYCDPQFPDIAYRWGELNFPGDPSADPHARLFCIPHFLGNPNMPGKSDMMMVIRFPNHNYTIVTVSSYQGEVKKGMLSHWIHHVYRKGGTGEHASLKEFTIRDIDGKPRKVVMCVWGLTGSGKSTHGMYVLDDVTGPCFKRDFGVDLKSLVSDQTVKNDDIVAVFEDHVYSPERGSWTKTEGVDEFQPSMYRAGMAERALHENTEWGPDGNVSFAGELFQYCGTPNRNARSVFQLEDTGNFDGNVNSSGPLTMAVLVSPGYLCDYAWLKLADATFAAKVLADGRTVGHPAQSLKGVGEPKYSARYCLPFTMGVTNADHANRFYAHLKKRAVEGDAVDVYLLNTTGRVGSRYEWVEEARDGKKVEVARTIFEERNGKKKPAGGTGPSIEETELFLHQAARGAVKYEPHPVWGDKALVPVSVEGLKDERLKELNPFTYHSIEEIKRLLKAQVETARYYLGIQCAGLDPEVLSAMDF